MSVSSRPVSSRLVSPRPGGAPTLRCFHGPDRRVTRTALSGPCWCWIGTHQAARRAFWRVTQKNGADDATGSAVILEVPRPIVETPEAASATEDRQMKATTQ